MSALSGVRAVLFDLDDTLLDWSEQEYNLELLLRPHLSSLFEYLEQTQLATDEDYLFFLHAFYDYCQHSWSGRASDDGLTVQPFEELIRGAMSWSELDHSALDLDAAMAAFDWRSPPKVKPFEDTVETLELLVRRGFRLGVITNSFMSASMRQRELKEHGLLPYIELMLTCGDVGKGKPSPIIFERALSELGLGAQEVIFVGDSLEADIRGAKDSQITSVLYLGHRAKIEPKQGLEPDYMIKTLGELLKLLPAQA